MLRELALITAKRYILRLKKHDIPVLSAWLFGAFTTGKSNDDSVIDIALVLDHYEDTLENCLVFKQLRSTIDLRIEPHPFDKNDFIAGNPCVDFIKSTGIALT